MAYNPYYGGGFEKRPPPNLGLQAYLGDPNSPLFNSPQFTPRTGGDLRGVQSFGTIQQPEEQNVGTVASQIDANLSALEGADKARQLYEDTTFGFNAQQGEWPGTIWKDITDFGSDVKTGAENVYTAGENLVTGSDKPMGLLSDEKLIVSIFCFSNLPPRFKNKSSNFSNIFLGFLACLAPG